MNNYESYSLYVSAISLLFSVYVFFKNKLYSNSSQESLVFSNITNAKNDVSKAVESVSALYEDFTPLGNSVRYTLHDARLGLIQAYEFAGQQYFSGAINRWRFDQLYSSEIMDLWTDPVYRELLQKGYYPSLIKLRKKYEYNVH